MPIALSDTLNLGDVFNKRIPYVIPRHQRTYSWTDDEIDDFCNDVMRVLSSPTKPYFFGGIVCVDKKISGPHGRQMVIIDGQQRLSTFLLYLSALRNAYVMIEKKAKKQKLPQTELTAKKRKEDLEERFMFYTDSTVRPPVQRDRLTLSSVDENHFHELINCIPPSGLPKPIEKSHKLLNSAYKTIYSSLIEPSLKTPSLDDAVDKIYDIQVSFLDNCFLTQIICDTEDDAFLLFEVLNDRGKELATCDHLRNWTLQKTAQFPKQQQKIAKCWDVIAESNGTERFLKAIVQSFLARRPGRILHQEIREQILHAPEPIDESGAQALSDQVSRILANLSIYQSLKDGDWPYDDGRANLWIKSQLQLLVRRLNHTMCIPFLMHVYEVKNEKFFGEVEAVLGRAVPRYINICGLRAVKLDNVYIRLISELIKNPDTFDIALVQSELHSIIATDATDLTLEERLRQLIYGKDDDLIRFIMLMCEYHQAWYNKGAKGLPNPDQSVVMDLKDLHIEHIYPQNAKPGENIPEIEGIKNTIGNLTIMRSSDNRAASNDPFSVKKGYYEKSSIAITRSLTSELTWDLSRLQDRFELYVEMCKKIFYV